MTSIGTAPAMTGDEIVALSKQHTIYEWSAQSKVDPIPVARAKGIYFWTPEGKRYIDFNSQLMCVNIGHGDERVIRAIQEQAAVLAYANPFMATEPRARLGAKLAEISPGDIECSFSPTAAPRPTRTRSRSRAGTPGGRRSWRVLSLVPRRHGGRDQPDRRSAPLGSRAGDSRRRPRPRSVSRHSARLGQRGDCPGPPRRNHPARRRQHHRRTHPRAGDRHQRHPRAARRIPRRASARCATSTASS